MRSSPHRRQLYWACLAVIALLFIFSVPWYRDPDEPLTLWLGLPDWVAVAVLCYVAVAVVNAIAWLLIEVPDEVVDSASSDAFATSGPGTASSLPEGRSGSDGSEASG